MYRKYFAATMSAMLIVSSLSPMVTVSAKQYNDNGSGQAAQSEQKGNKENAPKGPKRAVEDVELIDSTSFMIDFDKTYPKGLDINRMVDVEVELADGTVLVPELTDYEVSSEDQSLVTVEHENDDLDDLTGTLTINGFETDFDYGPEESRITLLHDTHFHGNFGDEDGAENIANYFGLVEQIRSEKPDALMVGNGDDLGSSLLSSVFGADPIVEAFNAGGLNYNTFGNHDFDMGPDVLTEAVEESDFTWVSANVIDDRTDDVFASEAGAESFILHDVNGVQVGITGLVTEDAPHITSMGDYAKVLNPEEAMEAIIPEMNDAGADIIVILSHLDSPVAEELAANVDGIDVILGDHAAFSNEQPVEINDTILSFVGDEFTELGELDLYVKDGEISNFNFVRHSLENVVAEEGFTPQAEVQKLMEDYYGQLDEELNEVIGENTTDLDTRRAVIRTSETGVGNYFADSVRADMDADIGFLNSGGIRSDTLYEPGGITRRMVQEILPFTNFVVKIEVTGAEVIQALEHGVSDLESTAGRFPQISGMSFSFDTAKDVGDRVFNVQINGESVDLTETYTIGTVDFIAGGGDGYAVFADAPVLIDANAGPLLSTLIMETVEADQVISPEIEGRITREVKPDEGYGYYDGTSIADVRDTDFGTDQTFYGTVTAHFEEGGQTNMYVQDDTAAILVRGSGLGSQYNIGDKVQFTGEHNHYRDMNQLLVSDSEIVEKNHGQITPKVVNSTFFANDPDDLQAQLIEIRDVTLNNNIGYNDYNAEDNEGNFLVLGAFSDVEENTQYDSVTGVVNYHFSENKLMPRNNDDLVEDASVVQPPRANQESGAIASGSEIILTSGTEDAEIYYTLNGEDPTESDTLYEGAITITEDTTLKAIAIKDGLVDSEVREYSYTMLAEAGALSIYDIQGSAHVSPYEGQVVREVPGIVTYTEKNGFYFQSEKSDEDVNTSEAVFVYRSGHNVQVGDDVLVDGEVGEYGERGYDSNDDLTTTQLYANSVEVVSSGNDLPDAMVIGIDRDIPKVLVADEENYDIYDSDTFNAEVNALDFYESLEGMLIEIPGQVTVTGPQKYDELTVISEEWGIENRTDAGGIYAEDTEYAANLNTEVMFVNVSGSTVAKTGDYFDESITGVLGYNFGNFKLEPVDALPTLQDGGNVRRSETTIEFNDDKLTVATYNVQNYYKGLTEKTVKLANSMANELNAPDIITLVEAMDNNGDTNDGTTSASQSYQALIDEIANQGGPQYAFTEVAPIDGEDGGIPGGNIRVGHLYRTDRVEIADGGVGESTEALQIDANGELNYASGRIDPTNSAFNSSRKSLLTEFKFKGESVYIIGNHWNSKRGDLAPYGMIQPAIQGSRDQREEIANVIGDFIAELNDKNEGANVVVLGDFNDYPWSTPVETMADKGELYNSIYELPRNQQYTYNYNGTSQSLDSILVSNHLQSGLDVDAMNINSEFMETHGRASDHDPFMVQLDIPNIDPGYEITPGPELTFVDDALNSNATIELTVGDEFTYPEVTATDYEGNNLTVERGGDDVDASIAGTYVVTYTATDSNDKTGDLSLTVIVKADLDRDNLTVAEAIANNDGEGTVQGYIVGTIISGGNGNFDGAGGFSHTNLMLADDPNETNMDKVLYVQLPFGTLRDDVNLRDNPDNLGEEVRLTGSLEAYFGYPGLKQTRDYEFVGNGDSGDEVTPISISDARDADEGTEVTVEGVVTSNPGSWGSGGFAIQDETGGIYVYQSDADAVSLGDEVRITGERDSYLGQVQITSPSIEVLGDGIVPDPQVINVDEVVKTLEGQLVQINGVEIANIEEQGTYGTFEFDGLVNGESVLIRVDNRSGLDFNGFTFENGDVVDVVGIIAEFNGTMQLLPRMEEDITVSGVN